MKKKLTVITTICIFLLVSAIMYASPTKADEAPLTIHQIQSGKHYQVMAKEEIVITAVTINDGLCEMSVAQRRIDYIQGRPKVRLPVKLQRGQKITFLDEGDCYVDDTTIHTTDGDYTFSWH